MDVSRTIRRHQHAHHVWIRLRPLLNLKVREQLSAVQESAPIGEDTHLDRSSFEGLTMMRHVSTLRSALNDEGPTS